MIISLEEKRKERERMLRDQTSRHLQIETKGQIRRRVDAYMEKMREKYGADHPTILEIDAAIQEIRKQNDRAV